MAGKEPRDIRVVWIRPVPGLAFIANEVGRRRGCRTMIETERLAHHPQADGAGTVLACEHGVVRPKGGGSARPNRSRRLVAVSGGRGADPGACGLLVVGLGPRAKLRRSIKVDVGGAQLIRTPPRPPGCSHPGGGWLAAANWRRAQCRTQLWRMTPY